MSAIIDTHIHLDSQDFKHDIEQVISESMQANVEHFIIPAASIQTLQHAITISQTYANVSYASGIHPCHVDEIMAQDIHGNISVLAQPFHQITQSIDSKKCRAIGECGLDFYHIDENDELEVAKQIQCFTMQIELALKHNLPLILHVRDSKNNYNASQKVAQILQQFRYHSLAKNLRGVFHCYNACEILLDFSDMFYYGIGGIITFKNASELVNILPRIPLDRIVLETDAPYLAPMPHRGKRNESKFLGFVVTKISEILNLSEDEICSLTTTNAKRLFVLE